MAIDAFIYYDKLLMRTIENNNFRIPDSKCLYAEVKIPGGWEKESVDKYIDKLIKDRAIRLIGKKEEINDHNERVLKNKMVNGMFNQINHISKLGFGNGGEEQRQAKTLFKIQKLKNKLNYNPF